MQNSLTPVMNVSSRPGRPREKHDNSPGAKTLDRGLSLLEALERGPMTLSEVSRASGLHASTASRLLRTLCLRGFVANDQLSGRYRIGSRINALAGGNSPHARLNEKLRPAMEHLHEQFNETVNLVIREGRQVVYLDNIESTHPLRMFTQTGARVPLHATGAGKTLLFRLSPEEIREILGSSELEAYTAKTITDPDRFIRHVRYCQKRGYALDREERQIGVRCVAVPVVCEGLPRASLSLSAPANRLDSRAQKAIVAAMLELAHC